MVCLLVLCLGLAALACLGTPALLAPTTVDWVAGHRDLAMWGVLGLYVCAALFALRLKQSRMVCLSVLYGTLPVLWYDGRLGSAAAPASLLLPAAALVFSFLRERGIWSRSGVLRLGLASGAAVLLVGWSGGAVGLLPTALRRPPESVYLPASPFPAAGLVLLLLCCGALLVFRRPAVAACAPELSVLTLLAQFGSLWTASGTWPFAAVGHAEATAAGAPVVYAGAAGFFMLGLMVEAAYREAFVDHLTQLPCRRAFDLRMRGLRGRFTIAMVDVDHFKRVNDTYGHDVGDQVLRFVAAQLRRVRGGAVYRYGGEEFAIVCPRAHAEKATSRLERLCAGIADRPFRLRRTDRPTGRKAKKKRSGSRKRAAGDIRVTVSIGVADRCRERRPGPAEVVTAADKALYKAKRGGRNRVVTV